MRAAPPVQVAGCGGWPWHAVKAGLPALALAALLAWALARHGWSVAPAPAAAAVLGAVLGRWLPRHRQALSWDGQAWSAEGRRGVVALQIDLDRWMLLRFVAAEPGPRPRVRWIALAASELPTADWHALRVAVHATRPAREPALPGA